MPTKKTPSVESVLKLFLVDGLSPKEIAKKTSSSVKTIDRILSSIAVGDTISFVKPQLLRGIKRSVDSFDTYARAAEYVEEGEDIKAAKELSAAARNSRENAQKAFDLLLLFEQYEQADKPTDNPDAHIETSGDLDTHLDKVAESYGDLLSGDDEGA